MTLIKSISGIRGTIGGKENESLTPVDVVKFSSAFAQAMMKPNNKKIVVGRDGRISGEAIQNLVVSSLYFMGADVINLELSTTPTVEMAVIQNQAAAGIIITASHNPQDWNALKLLNDKGEFISEKDGLALMKVVDEGGVSYPDIKKLGTITTDPQALNRHIDAIMALPLVNKEIVSSKKYKVIIDAINSTGAIAVPLLLNALGISNDQITVINPEITGRFDHNPEPLPENLRDISSQMKNGEYDLGIVVDPDVDRLCFLSEDGSFFGEEYTLVAIADYVLQNTAENKVTVSNLSSSKALKEITEKDGGKYYAAAVGEVNVVSMMKKKKAVIGGEGNGGIIYPELHYGRDALVGIALFLTYLAKSDTTVKKLRSKYPEYFISKNKIDLDGTVNLENLFDILKNKYNKEKINTIDGLKITFMNGDWLHLRPSNTEPIIRIYTESNSELTAENMAKKIMQDIHEVQKENR